MHRDGRLCSSASQSVMKRYRLGRARNCSDGHSRAYLGRGSRRGISNLQYFTAQPWAILSPSRRHGPASRGAHVICRYFIATTFPDPMTRVVVERVLKAGAVYFGVVFGAGFVLGTVRVIWVVPHLGERTAELIEAPTLRRLD